MPFVSHGLRGSYVALMCLSFITVICVVPETIGFVYISHANILIQRHILLSHSALDPRRTTGAASRLCVAIIVPVNLNARDPLE